MGLLRRLRIPITAVLLLLSAAPGVHATRILYREQLYQLYHEHFYRYPERIVENIYWLEQALRADFANPLHARARINDPREWEWYRYLFTMHINLKLTELYLQWAERFTKHEAFFFNAPWRDQNLESLERAEELMEYARVYWADARYWSDQAASFRFVHLPGIQFWEDQHHRIQRGSLNYETIIDRHLARLRAVRADFEAMDTTTY